MIGQNDLFTKESLNKLRSPDKLDSLFPVISPINWVGLITVCFLLFAVLMWSIFGSLVEKVEGTGMLLNPGGDTKVYTLSGGRVDSVLVKPGDMVHKGQTLITIFHPEAEISYELSKDNTYFPRNDDQYRKLNSEFDSKRFSRLYNSMVVSPCDGVVDQMGVVPEMMVSAGSGVCVIRKEGVYKEYGGVFYVPAPEGYKIIPGMLLQLNPGGYKEERDGQLMVLVTRVTKYPIDLETVKSAVHSASLASSIMSGFNNSCLEVRFRLIKDAKSTTGYLWTTAKGPDKPLEPGTVVTGYAVVERVPPIGKVFYKIESLLRPR